MSFEEEERLWVRKALLQKRPIEAHHVLTIEKAVPKLFPEKSRYQARRIIKQVMIEIINKES